MSYRRSFSLSWLVLAIFVLFLANLQSATAQPDEPATPPVGVDAGQPIVPPQPEKMKFQPPADADSVSDFLPPQTRLIPGNVVAQELTTFHQEDITQAKASFQITDIPLRFQRDTAIEMADGKLNVIVEGDTFDTQTSLEVRSLTTLAPQTDLVKIEEAIAQDENTLFMRFELEIIDENKQSLTSFEKNVRMVLDVRQYGIDVSEVGGDFYLAYENPSQPGEWLEVPITTYDSQGLISAEVNHFSSWETGWRPNGWTFQWNPPTPDPYTGTATYNYPFSLPPGRGGLVPEVSLNYSSGGLRGFSNRGSGWGSVATAWNLSGISITRTKFEYDTSYQNFRLIINGKGGRLIQGGSEDGGIRYYVEDEPSLHVISYNGTANSYWIVTEASGTQYRLGYTPTSITRHTHKGPSSGDHDYDQGFIIGWHVDTITDIYGNQINYDYVTHIRTTSMNPLYLYIRTYNAELSQITYNFNNKIPDIQLPATKTVARLSENSSVTAATKIKFIYAVDPYYNNVTGENREDSYQQLAAVEVYHGNQAHWLRRYALDAVTLHLDNNNPAIGGSACRALDSDGSWGGATFMRTLNVVWEEGWDKNNNQIVALPATRFTYTNLPHFHYSNTNCMIYKYLTRIETGYGGHVNFTYLSDGRSDWSASLGILKAAEQYVLNTMSQNDGRNQSVVTTYEYFDRCYDQKYTPCRQPETKEDTEYGSIAGHGRVIITTKNFDGSLLTRQILNFYNEIAKQGKVSYQESGGFINGSFIVSQSTNTTYKDDPFANNVRFMHVEEVTTTQYHSGLGTASLSTKTSYGYNPTLDSTIYQKDANGKAVQLGQLTHVYEYKDGVPYRLTRNWYQLNNQNGNWMIQPTSSALYDGDSWNMVSANWNYYDDSNSPGVLPAAGKGALTRVRQAWEIPCNPIPVGCAHAYQTIDSGFTYDAYGNAETSTTYQNYGYRTVNSSWAEIYNLFAENDPNKIVQSTSIAYDSPYYLYPVAIINSLGQTTSFEVYGFNGVPVDGFQSQPGLLKQVTGPDQVTTKYEYDPFGRLHAVYDANTTYLNDDFAGFGDALPWNGDPVTLYRYWDNSWNDNTIFLNPAGNAPFEISTQQRPGSFPQPTNSYGGVAYNDQTFYDGFGRPIQTRSLWHPVEGEALSREIYASTAYGANGQVVCQTIPYDKAYYSDSPRSLVWPASPFVNEACTSKPHTATTYDAMGRPQVVTAPDGGRQVYHYGISGGLAYQDLIDPNRHRIQQNFNSLGQLVRVNEITGNCGSYWSSEGFGCISPNTTPWAADAATTYAYDTMGNLIDVWDAVGNNTHMTYDRFGRKTGMNDPDMGNWTYAYNAAGSLTSQVDANTKRLCFTYDTLNRLTYKRYDSNNNGCDGSDTQLAYYAYFSSGTGKVGQLSEIRWSDSSTQNKETFNYDTMGRLASQTRLVDNRSYLMSYGNFDALNRPLARTITFPNGNTDAVNVTYDREGENTLSGGGSSLVSTVGYNEQGQLKRLALGNTLTTWYGYHGYQASGNNDAYDALSQTWNWTSQYGRLWRTCTAPNASTICQAVNKDQSANGQVMDIRMGYDSAGNVIAARDYLNNNQVQKFSYDHLNRLVTASTEDANGSSLAAYNHSYTYNQIGNITSQTEWTGQCSSPPGPCQWGNAASYAYTYSAAHKHAAASAKGVVFSYDANGNMTLRDASGTANDFAQAFNVENELTTVTNNSSSSKGSEQAVTSFSYDAAGMRTKAIAPNGVTTYYPFPGYEEEVNGSTTTRRITYSAAGQAIALRVQVVGGGNTLYYLHSDHLGSTSLATSSTGVKVLGSESRYLPFGGWRTEPTAYLTDRGFTGHLHNNIGTGADNIGLVYMNARYYLPGIGRFASADTIVPNPTNPQSLNRYSYVRNSPLNMTDPTGHRECDSDGWCAPGSPGSHYQPPKTPPPLVTKLWINPEVVTAIQPFGNTNFAFNLDGSGPSYAYSQGFHGGLDLLAASGTEVSAGIKGKVTWVATGAYGPNYVVIEIALDTYIVLGHLGEVKVKVDDVVTAGTVVGTVADRADVDHLHVEFWTGPGDSISPRTIETPYQYMSPEVKVQFIGLMAEMNRDDVRRTFHNRSDGMWSSIYDQPQLIYNGSNLNEGQSGYVNPWP